MVWLSNSIFFHGCWRANLSVGNDMGSDIDVQLDGSLQIDRQDVLQIIVCGQGLRGWRPLLLKAFHAAPKVDAKESKPCLAIWE
jgi:hypothetical protein